MVELSHRESLERGIDLAKYADLDYLDGRRWASYREAVRSVIRLRPCKILEVGPGNGIASAVYRALGYDVCTVDISDKVGPDVLGSVTALPFSPDAFDLVIAQQVLEHLPFEHFQEVLMGLAQVAPTVLISLPHISFHVTIGIKLPTLRWHTLGLTAPLAFGTIDSQHCWELGRNVKPSEIRRCFRNAGLAVERDFRVPEHPYHHFYILRRAFKNLCA